MTPQEQLDSQAGDNVLDCSDFSYEQTQRILAYAERLAARRVAEARVELLKAQVQFNYSHAENVERLRLAEAALADRLTKEGVHDTIQNQ